MTSAPTEKLLGCPFCGGEAYFTKSVNGSNMIYAGCSPCGVHFKAQNIYQATGEWKPTMDVRSAWNTRAKVATPTDASLVEKLVTALGYYADSTQWNNWPLPAAEAPGFANMKIPSCDKANEALSAYREAMGNGGEG